MTSRARALSFIPPVLALVGVGYILTRRESTNEARAVAANVGSGEVVTADEPSAPEASAREVAAIPLEPSPAAAVVTPTADSLAAQMHALEDTSPERALELARTGAALWPAGPRAAEFAATEVKSLYRLGKPSEGRGAAEAMVNKYPGSPWALEVEKQTGAHPYLNH